MKGSAGSTLGIENGICIEIKNRVWEERRPFMAYIEFNNVTKEYKTGETSIKALDGASFSVEKGELAVILGSSGAGKTTALNILGGMDVPTAGEIKVDGRDIAKYNKKQLVGYRRTDIGFVFQFYNLVPNLTAIENVELAAQVCRNSLDAGEMLTKVGLADRKNNFPAQLSGGEQILQLLQDTCRNDGITVLLITHNSALAPMADRLIRFKSGKVTEITCNAHPTPIAEIEW